ncbi:hypothetical protein [Fimbriimonas ginsengisoli]|uniref:Uncharacterized protein n=1 Tax=Fimbriimonas ginsengisoli Gsoil 348 TaxID=661478 RepID=A0A068NMM9_FIMGI|nr:hypothetical protein [Fimbriimonas ginsengisoli]AIE84637.1 hypothetical protein OP10G_1269 [Fimbriimonas ginsengisoli Gsoil 348]
MAQHPRILVRRLLILSVVLVAAEPIAQALNTVAPSTPFAHVGSKEIDEMSGIAKSARFKDTYWVHNDSGDTARIFAIKGNGELISEVQIPNAQNVDWEEISRDRNTLIVSDMGNNKNRRKDLGVYLLPEPDPTKVKSAPAALHIPIAYPDQKEFPPKGAYEWDCEAFFPLNGKLYFISKTRLNSFFPGTIARLYRLDTRDPRQTNMLKLVDQTELGGWVTAASVSPDRKRLAVLTHLPEQAIWLFDTGAKGEHILSGRHPSKISLAGMGQSEAICWDDARTLRVGNEEGDLFRVPVKSARQIR